MHFVLEYGAGKVENFTRSEMPTFFRKNAHVYDKKRFNHDKETLVLVKGTKKSRLLKKVVLISEIGQDCKGRPLKILSKKMQSVFGDFDGHLFTDHPVQQGLANGGGGRNLAFRDIRYADINQGVGQGLSGIGVFQGYLCRPGCG